MSALANPSLSQKSQTKESLLAGDTAVYLLLTFLVWATWRISQLQLFKAGDDVGYWIGVAGGVMMLLLFTYPLRKRFRVTQGWGKLKWWFWVHMVLGVGGPLLILLHSTFHIGSLNAGVALYSMLIVAASGVVGRFIYARINRGLRGEKTTLKELQAKAGLDQEEARSRLAFTPEVERLLKAFEDRELKAPNSWFTHVRRVFWLPLGQWWAYRQCLAALQDPIRKLAQHGNWSDDDFQKREGKCRRLIRRYLTAVTRVAQFTAYERLFSLWHVAHIPFVYLLILSAIIHVVAVHAY
jgi:hypothetical protein